MELSGRTDELHFSSVERSRIAILREKPRKVVLVLGLVVLGRLGPIMAFKQY